MDFLSTRDKKLALSGAEVIIKGISDDGGLFVPSSFPVFNEGEMRYMAGLEYADLAAYIMGRFITDIDAADLKKACGEAYKKFEDGDPAPVMKVDDGLFMCELYHGTTHAFKDIALSVLPHLMTLSKKKLSINRDIMILVATSGDTGKAALEGFKDVPGTKITVLYPESGVSVMQKRQMQSQTGDNVAVYGIKGNFDDAQRTVKNLFSDKEFMDALSEKRVLVSSANSINFGRLVPQIVYYFYSYFCILESREIRFMDKINFVVPTGNFGNILAGYYAHRMGLPVNKLICASNRNNVLTDFFDTGAYDIKGREFYKTASPSMDILVSSNLERLLFELSGRDDAVTAERMKQLSQNKKFKVTDKEKQAAAELFAAYYADDAEAAETLYGVFDDFGYISDPHTAVALSAYYQHTSETKDKHKTVVISTASPYKFAADVMTAIKKRPNPDPFKCLKQLENQTALPVPASITSLEKAELRFKEVLEQDAVKAAVLKFAAKK